ncbi:YicC/YloC family endoribonuclease [Porphyromonas circumdentaria]|uniref:YicC/YloC family endoribonuclease n=1 Tax=Porphyromonas circumdentaria TaxID=29524 RepID=UPI0026DAA2AB|nr:YicC/YloC family endoribonuclease [Porphyromonas circumdentaria]MDO4721721.1 YicC/YloC family endoribonuclease [Porphyromonas circumdentaria]
MLLSMTGFGKSEAIIKDHQVSVSIRTLNSKQLELSLRIPPLFKESEPLIRNVISSHLVRGKAEVTITATPISSEVTLPSSNIFDHTRIALFYEEIKEIAHKIGVACPDDILTRLLSLPGSLLPAQELPTSIEEADWAQLEASLLEAIEGLRAFRTQEGAMVEQIFTDKLNNISLFLTQITPFEEERIRNIRQKFSEELSKLEGITIDQNRLEQEIIYYIEKLDINEEKHRLSNHLRYFMTTMNEGNEGGIGKKLGFIAQEIGREINTLGSKSNNADMQRLVVQMKDELEQIKEQVLNIL